MNKQIKSVCAVIVSASLVTCLFTACSKKVTYDPSGDAGDITNSDIPGMVVEDNTTLAGGTDSGNTNGGSGYTGGSSGGGSSNGGGYNYNGSGSNNNGSGNNNSGSNQNSNQTTSTTSKTSTTTKYVFDLKKVLNSAPLTPLKTNDEELDERIDKIFAQIIKPGMSTYDKVVAIYDYLVQTNEYGFLMARSTYTSYYSVYDREIVTRAKTILKNRRGDCIDFAAAFAAMTRRIGLNCYLIKGSITNAAGVTTDLHGWNIMRIGGRDYAFDSQADFRNKQNGYTKFNHFGEYNPDKYNVDYTNLAEKSFRSFKYYKIYTPMDTTQE